MKVTLLLRIAWAFLGLPIVLFQADVQDLQHFFFRNGLQEQLFLYICRDLKRKDHKNIKLRP